MKNFLSLALLMACLSNTGSLCVAQQPPAPPKPSKEPAQKPAPVNGQDTKKTEKPASPKESANDLNKKGNAAVAEGKLDEAIGLFSQAVKLDPDSIQGYVSLGDVYSLKRAYPQAEASYLKAVEKNPLWAEWRFKLGSVLVEEEQYEAARAAFRRASELSPQDLRFRLAYGETFMRSKEYALARESFLMTLGYAPENPLVHVALGNVAIQENRFGNALEEYDAALRAEPRDMNAALGKISALTGLKLHEQAIGIAGQFAKQFPKEAIFQSTLAQALDGAGRYEEAITAYTAALQLTPKDAFMWGNLGWSQYNAGKYTEGIISSRKALEIDPKLAYVRLNLGLLYAVQDKWSEAEKEYLEAVKVSAVADVQAGLKDIRDARKKNANVVALQKSEALLSSAEEKLATK